MIDYYYLTPGRAVTLRVALRASLQTYGIQMIGETARTNARSWYGETSLIDCMVREYIRLDRYILGGKHYNNAVHYQQPKAVQA